MPTAPTATELLQEPIVQQAMDQPWVDSLPGDPVRRHEEGGWIFMDVTTGVISIRRAPKGWGAAIRLDAPPLVFGAVVVSKFHTHPNPSSEGWDPGPSDEDTLFDDRDGVPDPIVSDQGIFVSGPASRRNGLSGPLGFPL